VRPFGEVERVERLADTLVADIRVRVRVRVRVGLGLGLGPGLGLG